MALLALGQSTLSVKKSNFSRTSFRDRAIGEYFKRASFGLTAYGKVLVDFFFTPAVATSSIMAGGLFLLLANMLLALGSLTTFASRLYYNEVSTFEVVAMTATIAASITLAIFIAPPMSLIFGMSVVASAINYVFLVKNLIIPPLKHLIEKALFYFDIDIRGEYYFEPPLDEVEDEYAIRRLLRNQPLNDGNRHKFEAYNKAIKKLCDYHNKYTEELLGSIFRKEDLEELQNDIFQLKEGSAKYPMKFFEKKISHKTTKRDKFHKAMVQLTRAEESGNIEEYNRLGELFFEDYTSVNLSELNVTSELLLEQIHRQEEKIRQLVECVPHDLPSP